MFQNWLLPIKPQDFLPGKLNKYQFGEKIQVHSKKMPKLKNTRIAIIGFEDADPIRREIYQMSAPFARNKVADLGNIRKKEISFVIPLLKELMESGILPVLLSPDPTLTLAQYKAHKNLQRLINLVCIDEKFRFDPEETDKKAFYLNEIVKGKRSKLFNLGLIGAQTHFINPKAFDFIDKRQFDCMRLGNAKARLNELEPIIRDGDLMCFNLSALKRAEIPDQEEASPSGFSTEEACQICRYAGMNEKLKSFGIYQFSSVQPQSAAAQVTAQLIWYFIEGYFNRKNDFPASTDGLVEYIVDFKEFDTPITFWKSKKSGRWWMQVQAKSGKKHQGHHLVPCSYNDYKQAVQGDLSDRLFQAYQRFL